VSVTILLLSRAEIAQSVHRLSTFGMTDGSEFKSP
jgi:hypothetical protein